MGSGEMFQSLRMLTVLAEDLCLVTSTHMADHSGLYLQLL